MPLVQTHIQTFILPLWTMKEKNVVNTRFSPLVDKDKLAVDGVPGHVFGGLHPDVGQTGLGDDVRVQATDGHQAAQVAALVVGLVVLVQAHLGGRPALQVTRAVDGAEALAVGCEERQRQMGAESEGVNLEAAAQKQPAVRMWW